MAIEVRCPGCGKILHLADHVAGKKGKCPACGMVMEIPGPDEGPPVEASIIPPATAGGAEDVLQRYQRKSSGGTLGEYLRFDRMITPVVIQVLFWFGVLVSFVMGGLNLFDRVPRLLRDRDVYQLPAALVVCFFCFIVGPVLWRIYCEVLIVLFRIHSSLKRIEENTTRRE
jgi:phage FluMu protein Com